MVLEFPRERVQAPQQVARPSKGIARPTAVRVIDHEFHDEVQEKRSSAAEPIKDLEDIVKVQQYLVSHQRYRDNLLFICGINLGLRISDLRTLKVGHLLNQDGMSYRDKITIIEQKTKKERVVFPNDAVMDAADLYFQDLQAHSEDISLNDYLFQSASNNSKSRNEPMTRRSVERMLKEVINDQCGLDIHASTHCMRKTFAYQVIMNAPDRSRAIEFLQKIFGHSSQSVTLRYAGITDKEIEDTYRTLNLGRVESWNVSTGLACSVASSCS